jgi:hypothetical protein
MIGALTIAFIKLIKKKLDEKNPNNVKINNFWRIIQECYLDTWAIFCNMQLIGIIYE